MRSSTCCTTRRLKDWSIYSALWTAIQSAIGIGFGIKWIAYNEHNMILQSFVITISILGLIFSCILIISIYARNTCGLMPWLLLIAMSLVLGCLGILAGFLLRETTAVIFVGIFLVSDVVCFCTVLSYYDVRCERSFRRHRRRPKTFVIDNIGLYANRSHHHR